MLSVSSEISSCSLSAPCRVPALPGLDQLHHFARSDVCDDARHANRPERQEGKRQTIITGVNDELVAAGSAQLRDPARRSTGFLDADDVGMLLHQNRAGLGCDLDPAATPAPNRA
jgi:hypothetical protein